MKLIRKNKIPHPCAIPYRLVKMGDIETYRGHLSQYHELFSGFKTFGVASCFVFLAVYQLPTGDKIPVAMSHYVCGSSKETIDDARLDIEEHLDNIIKELNKNIPKIDSDNLFFIALGGQSSSKNYYRGLKLIAEIGEYNLHEEDIHFYLAPDEEGSIDVLCNRMFIVYHPNQPFKMRYEYSEIEAAKALCHLYDTLREEKVQSQVSDRAVDKIEVDTMSQDESHKKATPE